VRELGKFPVKGEIVRKARADKTFPSHTLFSRFGGKEKLIEAAVAWCDGKSGFDDIIALDAQRKGSSTGSTELTCPRVPTGYLLELRRIGTGGSPTNAAKASGSS